MSLTLRALLVASLALAAAACGPGIPGGPSMNNKLNQEAEPPPPEIQSNDILARDAVTREARVKHILVGFQGLGDSYPGGRQDPRGAARSRADADKLAVQLLERVRAGEAIEPLMAEFSEDSGSAQTGDAYTVTADAQFIFEFKRLALRLQPGEAGLVLTGFGWHVMKRIE
jgi:hypothetical protein